MNMKIQNIYHLLQAALLLLLASCMQEEFPAAQDKAQQLAISVTDGGYASIEGKTTRAVENGYTTEFTEGDACGLFVTRGMPYDRKMVYANVKLTAETDAATGQLVWKPEEGTTLVGGLENEEYHLYYPYKPDLDDQFISRMLEISRNDPNLGFFWLLENNWQVKADQSTYEAYTASDLMTASCTPIRDNGTLRLDFVMTHVYALAVIEMPKTVYEFVNAEFVSAGIPDYTVPSEVTFTSTAKPLRMADGSYRYLLPTSLPTIEGNYDEGNKEFTITPSEPTQGMYKKYKVDGALTTKRPYRLQVGDFFLADGNLMPYYAEAYEVQTANVVGIVFQIDPSRIGQAEKDKLGGNVHGLVMAVKNAATSKTWGSSGQDEDLTKCNTKADNYNDISGYGNCEHIRSSRGNFDDYPAFKAAYDYNTTCPVPATTTGWYLPASGQWWDILQNLGGCSDLAYPYEQTSSESKNFSWSDQGNVPKNLNFWMEKIAADSKNDFSRNNKIWSSSEYSPLDARYWYVDYSGNVRCQWCRKEGNSRSVRPVLAF